MLEFPTVFDFRVPNESTPPDPNPRFFYVSETFIVGESVRPVLPCLVRPGTVPKDLGFLSSGTGPRFETVDSRVETLVTLDRTLGSRRWRMDFLEPFYWTGETLGQRRRHTTEDPWRIKFK